MDHVRIGILGLGNMGRQHAATILADKIPRLVLAAAADADPARLSGLPSGVRQFTDPSLLLDRDLIDAVLIATPHFSHVPFGITALRQCLHVLVEKPIAVHKADCERLLAAHTNPSQVFAAMFNQRTDGHYQQIRRMVRSGELGAIHRVQWTVTNWFRTHHYYASGGWRGTWAGEGGGVLLNQAPHNLDLFWWIFGQPAKLRAHCHFGKHHDVEVEDEVTAYAEFDTGATAVLIFSTGEAPGVNRLEIAGDGGYLVFEQGRIRFTRNIVPTGKFSRESAEMFAMPPSLDVSLPAFGTGGQHAEVLANFSAAILEGADLIAPAGEGIHSIELANAMLLSTWSDSTVTLPLDALTYQRQLEARMGSACPSRPADATDNDAIVGSSL